MTASFLWLKHGNGENLLKIGSVIVGLGSALDAAFSKGSQVMAERLFALIIERNPAARPAYFESGETMLATARVGHSRMSIIGGSFLRATDRRLIELEAEKSGALAVKLSLPYNEITGGTLTTVKNQNSIQYELLVHTTGEKHKFVADGDYEDQMKLIRDRINQGRG
jgi:hypothetical protein